jgi:hypothetical protein
MRMRNAIITKYFNIEKEIGALNLFSLITQDTGSFPILSILIPSLPSLSLFFFFLSLS